MDSSSLGERVLFYACTPLQLLNAMYLSSQLADIGTVSDLFVYEQFSEATEYVKSVSNSGFFQSVYICESASSTSNMDAIKKNPLGFLNTLRVDLQAAFSEDKPIYNAFFLACPNSSTFSLLSFLRDNNPNIDVLYYEDGTGSYTGYVFSGKTFYDFLPTNVQQSPWRRASKRLLKLLHGNRGYYCADTMYVKKPQAIMYEAPLKTKRIVPSERVVNFLSGDSLWTGDESLDKSNVIIFDCLRENGANQSAAAIIDELVTSLTDRQVPCYFKTHPRSDSSLLPTDEGCIRVAGMWEAKCHIEDMRNRILVGMFSSAQLSPYLETGVQPYLLFLNGLSGYESQGANTKESITDFLLRLGYSPERFVFPDTIDEALTLIESYIE
jgi:hypothetical protein